MLMHVSGFASNSLTRGPSGTVGTTLSRKPTWEVLLGALLEVLGWGWEGLTEGWLTGLQVFHGAALGASVRAVAPWLPPGCSGQKPALVLPVD
jgi:hypothetical protein